ncbi:CLK4-associating serine/arginine rich protein-like isoform X2 [Daktulosphaira vitifoliae]|uniref:CLK4-associating serine/arginine rich protein-like isoform X2 n=1 Tax=Daktulosphaira vitifoliae TaxID=58002 RepID=UPI0021A9C441|nr:CLK4-associating serine/arginine rich protein-like isoform X2 [Daktulosphaira vitifoliae]
MWHEARKQEKKIRGLLVDYQRRAQRRKDFYEKIKADPTQFLQLHGRQCKIHIDPGIAIAANSPATMMPWQGNDEIMIDRFDARAHLDFIREPKKEDTDDELSYEERQLNYERYRILVQNEFLSMPESKFLHQLLVEEKFGPVGKSDADDAKKKSTANAAIPYKYNDDEDTTIIDDSKKYLDIKTKVENSDDSDEESEVDFDLSIDISKIGTDQANELNTTAHNYGMTTNDFYSFLNNDLEEAENIQLTRLAEEEKAMFAGRRSRRERRAYRLKALEGKALSPLSYATRKSPSYNDFDKLSSMATSRSPTPENTGQVTYITSFGDEEQAPINEKSKSSNSKSSISKHSSSRKKRSRTRSPHKKSKSPSKHLARWRRSLSRNKSVSPARTSTPAAQKPPPIQRYYGRRGKDSSSELSLSEDEDSKNKKNTNNHNKISIPDISLSSSSKKNSTDKKPTPQEIMKRKMQVLLNKQYKADKKAQRERELKMEREQIEREEEIKELSLKMRRRRRRLRHPENSSSSSSSSSSQSKSRSKSRSPSSSSSSSSYSRYRKRRRRSRSRSRSAVRHRSRSSDRRRRSRSDDRRRVKRNDERDRYKRDDRRDYDRRDDYRSRRSPDKRNRREDRRDSPIRRDNKQRESPDRRKKEIVDNRPAARITYEASPKRYVPSAKPQTTMKPLVDY